VKEALNLFGISNLLNLGKQETPRNVVAQVGDKRFYLEPQPKASLAEVPKWEVRVVKNNWSHEVEKWWLEENFRQLLVYDPAGELKELATREEGKVSILKNNRDWTEFVIDVDSSTETPVLVKFGFSPNWKAFSNDKEIKIYKASPSLMLVKVRGQVRFEYQQPLSQLLLVVASFVSLAFLAFVRKKVV
jgi:hypothetical protein